MSNTPKTATPIARIMETNNTGIKRTVGFRYCWNNGEKTEMFMVEKSQITGALSTLEIRFNEIAGDGAAN